MIPDPKYLKLQTTVREFRRARREASMQQLVSRLTGKSNELLAYNEVCERLKVGGGVELGVQEIPLDAIVGSVGRYQDFTRSFLPKSDQDEDRWVGVKTAVNEMVGMPPIDVYKVGDAYFVNDGNHRVSVARQLNSGTIAAYVTEVTSRVPLTDHADPDELICKERYLEFLEKTNLDKLRPEADLSMTFAGHYRGLFYQIAAHQEQMTEQRGEPVPYADAVASWYDDVYLLVVDIIREQGILHSFPERTEADMYGLLSERREELEEALGWSLDTETAVSDLIQHTRSRLRPAGVGAKLVPPSLVDGPEPGDWRRSKPAMRNYERLFVQIMVSISGKEEDWQMVDTALEVARREKGRLMGLHIVPEKSQKQNPDVKRIQDQFAERCRNVGIRGELVVAAGNVTQTILKRSIWADLVVVNLMHPPSAGPLRKLGSGFNRLIQSSPRPILVLPRGRGSAMKHALLAYDGSAKAGEGLFVAAYMAMRWHTRLSVITVETKRTSEDSVLMAQEYLAEYGVEADFYFRQGNIGQAVLETAVAQQCDFLIMGGFGFRPVTHLVLGSTVDRMLRECKRPMLICR